MPRHADDLTVNRLGTTLCGITCLEYDFIILSVLDTISVFSPLSRWVLRPQGLSGATDIPRTCGMSAVRFECEQARYPPTRGYHAGTPHTS